MSADGVACLLRVVFEEKGAKSAGFLRVDFAGTRIYEIIEGAPQLKVSAIFAQCRGCKAIGDVILNDCVELILWGSKQCMVSEGCVR